MWNWTGTQGPSGFMMTGLRLERLRVTWTTSTTRSSVGRRDGSMCMPWPTLSRSPLGTFMPGSGTFAESPLTFRFSTWNVGGSSTAFLSTPEGSRAVGSPSALHSRNEVGRAKPGWHVQEDGKTSLISHRHEDCWRGTGMFYHQDVWSVMRNKASKAGTWFRIRHLETCFAVWLGSIYISPSAPMIEHQELLRDHLESLPPTALPVYLAGVCNAAVQ